MLLVFTEDLERQKKSSSQIMGIGWNDSWSRIQQIAPSQERSHPKLGAVLWAQELFTQCFRVFTENDMVPNALPKPGLGCAVQGKAGFGSGSRNIHANGP